MKRKTNLNSDLNKITNKLKKIKVSSSVKKHSKGIGDLTNAFKATQIAPKLTEDEEYEIAMKELRDLVKSRVDNHLQQQKTYKDLEKERNEEKARLLREKKQKEKKELYKLLYGDSDEEM